MPVWMCTHLLELSCWPQDWAKLTSISRFWMTVTLSLKRHSLSFSPSQLEELNSIHLLHNLLSSSGGKYIHRLICGFQLFFIFRANDAPYGRFNITQPSINVDQTNFPEISRTFSYTIVRENGRIGDVLLNILTTYTPVSSGKLCIMCQIMTRILSIDSGPYC